MSTRRSSAILRGSRLYRRLMRNRSECDVRTYRDHMDGMFSELHPVVVRARQDGAPDAMGGIRRSAEVPGRVQVFLPVLLEISMRILALSSTLMLVLGAAHAAQPAKPAPAPRAMPAPVTAASTQLSLQGKITALDKSTRAVSITGPEVRNFSQLKVGDTVSLNYTGAVALELQPAGSAKVGVTKAQESTVQIPGAAPGGSRSNTVTLVTEVAAVNPERNTIALRGPRGNTQIVAVERDDLRAKLPSVKRGDLLRISYTEAVAISIRRDSP
jgi:hypothetical protein